MSDYIELINPQTMICKLLKNGEVVAEYKMEQCDKCSMLAKADEFGYQRGQRVKNYCGFVVVVGENELTRQEEICHEAGNQFGQIKSNGITGNPNVAIQQKNHCTISYPVESPKHWQ
jgi:hypothetical protein